MTAPATHGFCRDCLTTQQDGKRRCGTCGSPRMLVHSELETLSIAHIDCDAFYAAVEKRDRPDLADKPLIIGGGTRGVVLTACYNARIFGVRSAMPMFKALKLCPQATIIRPDMARYAAVGHAVRDLMRAVTPLVEPLSIDEAFLDLSGTDRLHRQSPAMTLVKLAKRIETELGITVSVGLSHNKFLAKLASDLEKPKGFSIIGRAETIAFLRDRSIGTIWGVGEVTARRLERDGLTRIGQLQAMDEVELMKRYGVFGQKLYQLSRGLDTRHVHPRAAAKSISAETTFASDLRAREDLLPILRALTEKVARRLKDTDLSGKTIVLKLKTSDFTIRSRNRTLVQPTRLAERIFEAGRQMLELELGVSDFRLIGIGVSEFEPASLADPADLVDPNAARRAKAEAAVDSLRDKFGLAAIETGYTFRPAAERADEAARKAARPREIAPRSEPADRASKPTRP